MTGFLLLCHRLHSRKPLGCPSPLRISPGIGGDPPMISKRREVKISFGGFITRAAPFQSLYITLSLFEH